MMWTVVVFCLLAHASALDASLDVNLSVIGQTLFAYGATTLLNEDAGVAYMVSVATEPPSQHCTGEIGHWHTYSSGQLAFYCEKLEYQTAYSFTLKIYDNSTSMLLATATSTKPFQPTAGEICTLGLCKDTLRDRVFDVARYNMDFVVQCDFDPPCDDTPICPTILNVTDGSFLPLLPTSSVTSELGLLYNSVFQWQTHFNLTHAAIVDNILSYFNAALHKEYTVVLPSVVSQPYQDTVLHTDICSDDALQTLTDVRFDTCFQTCSNADNCNFFGYRFDTVPVCSLYTTCTATAESENGAIGSVFEFVDKSSAAHTQGSVVLDGWKIVLKELFDGSNARSDACTQEGNIRGRMFVYPTSELSANEYNIQQCAISKYVKNQGTDPNSLLRNVVTVPSYLDQLPTACDFDLTPTSSTAVSSVVSWTVSAVVAAVTVSHC